VLKYKYKNAKRVLSTNIGWDYQIAERSRANQQKGVAVLGFKNNLKG
jgi:hypothetical protein